MGDAKDLTLVAYVEQNAISAAVGDDCDGVSEDFHGGGGAIGAAVPWQVGPNGTPR